MISDHVATVKADDDQFQTPVAISGVPNAHGSQASGTYRDGMFVTPLAETAPMDQGIGQNVIAGLIPEDGLQARIEQIQSQIFDEPMTVGVASSTGITNEERPRARTTSRRRDQSPMCNQMVDDTIT